MKKPHPNWLVLTRMNSLFFTNGRGGFNFMNCSRMSLLKVSLKKKYCGVDGFIFARGLTGQKGELSRVITACL